MNKEEIRHLQQKAAINREIWDDYDKLPFAWIARDKDNSLWLYDKKPRESGGMFYLPAGGEAMMQLPEDCYPDLTFELSPIKVRLMFIAE